MYFCSTFPSSFRDPVSAIRVCFFPWAQYPYSIRQNPPKKEDKYTLLIRKKLVCPRYLCSILVIRSACASSEAMARKRKHCLTTIRNHILKLTVNTKKDQNTYPDSESLDLDQQIELYGLTSSATPPSQLHIPAD